MVRIVVDSSILIEKIRRGSKYFDILLELEKTGRVLLYIPVVVIAELWAGESMSRNRDVKIVEHLITMMRRVEIDEKIAKLSGEYVRKYKIGAVDAIIGACAVVNMASVATLNQKDFVKLKELKLYKYETL